MVKNTLFILGDSTSMTIGCERHMYPFIMADTACWSDTTQFVNCSQPGFTAADACAFFFRHRRDFPTLKAVVINLGTCDAASWEKRKGRYSLARESLYHFQEAFGRKKQRTRLKNRLLHYEWNDTYDPFIEMPESPEDYEFNLSRIVKACVASSIPVVMVKPKANFLFLPGVGKGNFIFYRYWGINDRISARLSIPDRRFQTALDCHERGDIDGAMLQYREILMNPGILSFHGEYPLIVLNNYTVCAADRGDLDEAEFLYRLLLKERNVRREIVTFNLAGLYRMRGDEGKYRQFLAESYEIDSSMYRIRSAYLDAIDRVSGRYARNVRVIDMASFIEDSLYVDHTHPLKEGQERLASKVIECLKDSGMGGEDRAEIRNILYNPELAQGNTTEFYSYFRAYDPFSEGDISGYMGRLVKALNNGISEEDEKALLCELPREMRMALEYYLMHPCFPSIRFIIPFGPRYPSDTGRFPEFFIVRHILPYIRHYEKECVLKNDQFTSGNRILRRSEELLAILPPDVVPLVSQDALVIDPALESLRLPAILDACKVALICHLRSGNQVYERMKTTIFWYFRETLRYGSHSRISMRYNRTILEYIAEALAVASLINFRLESNHANEINRLIKFLEKVVGIHEDCCKDISESRPSLLTLAEYDRRLFEIVAEVEMNKQELICIS